MVLGDRCEVGRVRRRDTREVYGGYPSNQDSLPRNDDSGGTRTFELFSETITDVNDSGRRSVDVD